jgi:transcriptional regulator with XRE-family HTH domain
MKQPKTKQAHPVASRRAALGLSGYALAKKVGISPTHLHDIEHGRISSPSVEVALALAAALGVTVEELFGRAA